MEYYDEYDELLDDKKNQLDNKLKPKNLKHEDYNYGGWLIEEGSDDKH